MRRHTSLGAAKWCAALAGNSGAGRTQMGTRVAIQTEIEFPPAWHTLRRSERYASRSTAAGSWLSATSAGR